MIKFSSQASPQPSPDTQKRNSLSNVCKATGRDVNVRFR
jgi:hypothetical protein